MQSIIRDVVSEKKNRATFTHENISEVLFLNKSPLYTFFPFHKFKNFSGRRDSVTLRVKLFDSNKDSIEVFSNIIDSIGSVKISSAYEIPTWFASRILKEYKVVSSEWFHYLSEELKVYCDENLNSKIQWSSFIHNIPIFTSSLSFEQKLWIYTNTNRDAAKYNKFIVDIKDSILPWLNLKLYSEVKKKEENTRKNVEYEKQKKEMFESTNDIEIKPSSKHINHEDLDEVR